jgi:hypothetical protein
MNHVLIKFQGYQKFLWICSEGTCLSQILSSSVEFIVAISKDLGIYLFVVVCWFQELLVCVPHACYIVFYFCWVLLKHILSDINSVLFLTASSFLCNHQWDFSLKFWQWNITFYIRATQDWSLSSGWNSKTYLVGSSRQSCTQPLLMGPNWVVLVF